MSAFSQEDMLLEQKFSADFYWLQNFVLHTKQKYYFSLFPWTLPQFWVLANRSKLNKEFDKAWSLGKLSCVSHNKMAN